MNSCMTTWQIMEKIEITTRFSKQGTLLPQEIRIGEEVIPIRDIGRQWGTEEGQHILVMDARETTYHLFFKTADLSWYWIKDLKDPTGAV